MAYEDAIMIGSSVFLFLVFYISTKISKGITILGREPLTIEIFQPFFFILGLVYSMFHLELMITMADTNTQPVLAGLIRIMYGGIATIVLPLMVFWFVISFIYNLFKARQEGKESGPRK